MNPWPEVPAGLGSNPSQATHGGSDHIAHQAQLRPPVKPARYNYSAGKGTQCDEPQGFCGLQPERTSHPVLPGFTVRVQRVQGISGTCCNSGDAEWRRGEVCPAMFLILTTCQIWPFGKFGSMGVGETKWCGAALHRNHPTAAVPTHIVGNKPRCLNGVTSKRGKGISRF